MAIIKTYTLDDVYETAILLYVSEFTDAYFKKPPRALMISASTENPFEKTYGSGRAVHCHFPPIPQCQ